MTKRYNVWPRLPAASLARKVLYHMTIVPQKETWLTVKEYAEKYGVVPLTVYRMIKRNDLTVKRIGKNGRTIRILDKEAI